MTSIQPSGQEAVGDHKHRPLTPRQAPCGLCSSEERGVQIDAHIPGTCAQGEELARGLTASAGVPVAVVRRGGSCLVTELGGWDVHWSTTSPNIATMSRHVADLIAVSPDSRARVRFSWSPPSRRLSVPTSATLDAED